MLIVVEGPDLTGKTTLARRLAAEVGCTVRHAAAPTRPSIEEYETNLDDFAPGYEPLVLDRWHVGENVWPTVYDRTSDFDLPTRIHVEMFMRSRGALLVYGQRDPVKLAVELVENDEPLPPELLPFVTKAYLDARVFSAEWAQSWDYDYDGDIRIREILRDAKLRADKVKPVWDVLGPGWVGIPNPRVLLVGDELGPEKEGREPPNDVPFAPYKDTSGHYLLSCVEEWRDTAIVNAHQGRTGKVRNLGEVWNAFGRPKVVALGRRAADALSSAFVPHGEVAHPQFWRRFHYKERNEYWNQILKASE